MTYDNTIQWETFKDVGSRFGAQIITITENYGFGFSSGLNNEFHLKDFNYVILKFSSRRQAKYIGFKFTNEKSRETIRLTRRGNFAQIAVRSFFKKYNLDPKILKGTYPIENTEFSKTNPFLFIKINQKLQR